MHGDKSQRQREKALASFEAGRVDTLVATDVAARGIDVDRISHVINFDPPEDRDAYTHRVGRTGRAGRSGIGITLVDHDQAREVGQIARALKLDSEFARERPLGRRAARQRAPAAASRPGRQPPPAPQPRRQPLGRRTVLPGIIPAWTSRRASAPARCGRACRTSRTRTSSPPRPCTSASSPSPVTRTTSRR